MRAPAVQDLVWQRWREVRRRIGAELELALARLARRRTELGLVAALVVFFMVVGGLSPLAAMAGQSSPVADRLWRLVVDAVPEPAVALDNAGYVVHANHLAEELFGARRRGSHVASMSRDPELLAAVDQALAGRPCSVELHERVPVERRLLATVAPLERTRTGGDGPALLISFRDLSEQDRLARMRADFVANASHELRTPLAYLKGSVETLQGPAKDDPAARESFLRTMAEQAERMSRLVDDLLSLSRVEMREY